MSDEKNNKLLGFLPVAALALLTAVLLGIILIAPYDLPGTTPPNTYMNLANGGFVAEDGSMLYYVSGKGTLYCQSGPNCYRVDEGADSLCPYGSGIVYRLADGRVLYSNYRGEEKTVLLTDVEKMVVGGNWVFFTRADGVLHKRSLLTGEEKTLGLKVRDYLIAATSVLYSDDRGRLFTARTDGTGSEPFLAQPVDAFARFDSYVFYTVDGTLYSVASGNVAGKQTYFPVTAFNVTADGILFFTDDKGLHTYDLTDEKAKIRDVETPQGVRGGLCTWGERLCFYNGEGTLVTMLKDGSESAFLQ